MRDEAYFRASQARALAATFVCRRKRELHGWMARDEGAQLAAGVPACAKDSNRDSMHDECILLHQPEVNRPDSLQGMNSENSGDPAASLRAMLSSRHRERGLGVDKRKRQAAILELVEDRPVGSQEELRGFLRERGWDVTQSTLSRDLRELRLARVPTPDGVRYAIADGALSSAARPALDALLPQLLTRVDGVGELIVLRTVPGGAQPVASALDGESWPDVLGTVGGDDTILVVCRSATSRERIERRLRKLAEI